MKFPTFSALTTCAALLLVSALVSSPVQAGYLICKSHKLPAGQRAAVRAAITQAAEHRDILWSTLSSCINGQYSRTSVDLKDEPQGDGSLVHVFVQCKRGAARWACTRGQSRTASIDVVLEGRSRTIEFRLPLNFDLEQAKRLVDLAFVVAPKITSDQRCGTKPDDSPDARVPDWLRANQEAFRLLEPKTLVSVEPVDDTSVDLVVDLEVLNFSIDPNDATKLTYRCWGFQIVVT